MWTTDELARVRDQLAAQLRELGQARTGLAAEVQRPLGWTAWGDCPADPIQPTDQAAHRAGEEAAFGVLAEEERLEGELTDALARIEQDRYGVCERCGKRIAKERLRALPYAWHCVRYSRAGTQAS